MKASFDYTGCNVFVAGGTSGINLGIARAFAAAGARLGVASRRQEKVDAAVAQLGAGARGYAFDVRDAEATAAAFAAFAAEAGPIDVLVSGAAGNFPAAAKDLSPNGFKAVVDIDLLGTFHVMRAAYPHMKRPGGSLINISAPQASIPMAMQIHVCAAKAGVDMVTRCLAIEFHRGPAGERRRAGADRRHRGHGAPRAHRGDARGDHRRRADAAIRHPAGRGRRLPLPRLRRRRLRERHHRFRRRRLGAARRADRLTPEENKRKRAMNLVRMIDSSVGKFPDKPMIVAGDRSFTYAEAAETSRHIAGWLTEQGVGPGDNVAIMALNVPEFVIAMLGVWRIGAAVVPTNHKLADQEALYIVRHSKAKLALVSDEIIPTLVETVGATRIVPLVGGFLDTAMKSAPAPDRAIDETAAAEILYTSGTTGRPKGCIHTHRGVCNTALLSGLPFDDPGRPDAHRHADLARLAAQQLHHPDADGRRHGGPAATVPSGAVHPDARARAHHPVLRRAGLLRDAAEGLPLARRDRLLLGPRLLLRRRSGSARSSPGNW